MLKWLSDYSKKRTYYYQVRENFTFLFVFGLIISLFIKAIGKILKVTGKI